AAALALTREYKPQALTLDIFLPDMEGWRVLDRLKNDMETRHIPVAVISTDESRPRALRAGALAYLVKPLPNQDALDALLDYLKDYLSRTVRRVAVLSDSAEFRRTISDQLVSEELELMGTGSLADLLPMLRDRALDCLITGPEPPAFGPEILDLVAQPL